MKHTQGEWKVMFSESFEAYWIKANEKNIANINGGRDDVTPLKEAKANAKLIAAAPEILKALMMVIEEYDKAGGLMSQAMPSVRAAINKATE